MKKGLFYINLNNENSQLHNIHLGVMTKLKLRNALLSPCTENILYGNKTKGYEMSPKREKLIPP